MPIFSLFTKRWQKILKFRCFFSNSEWLGLNNYSCFFLDCVQHVLFSLLQGCLCLLSLKTWLCSCCLANKEVFLHLKQCFFDINNLFLLFLGSVYSRQFICNIMKKRRKKREREREKFFSRVWLRALYVVCCIICIALSCISFVQSESLHCAETQVVFTSSYYISVCKSGVTEKKKKTVLAHLILILIKLLYWNKQNNIIKNVKCIQTTWG